MTDLSHLANLKKPLSRSADYIHVKVFDKQKLLAEVNNAACFMRWMNELSKLTFEVLPYKGQSTGIRYPVNDSNYIRWMQLCADNDLMPPGTEFSVEDHHRVLVPAGSHRILVYAGLCLYRNAINNGRLVEHVLAILDHDPSVDFYQALHHGLAHHDTWDTHSFCKLGPTCYGESHKLSLAYSVSLAWLFRKKDFDWAASSMGIQANINKYVIQCFNSSWLRLRDIDDVLDHRWTQFYQPGTPTNTVTEEWRLYERQKSDGAK